jgi:hypothetical protein
VLHQPVEARHVRVVDAAEHPGLVAEGVLGLGSGAVLSRDTALQRGAVVSPGTVHEVVC